MPIPYGDGKLSVLCLFYLCQINKLLRRWKQNYNEKQLLHFYVIFTNTEIGKKGTWKVL